MFILAQATKAEILLGIIMALIYPDDFSHSFIYPHIYTPVCDNPAAEFQGGQSCITFI
jgi:hypothetical protein